MTEIQHDLIVMRLANMHRIHPDQDNSHVCSQCNEQVGIYPSGQAMMRQFPHIRLICEICNKKMPSADMHMLAPGALEENAESVDAKPPSKHS